MVVICSTKQVKRKPMNAFILVQVKGYEEDELTRKITEKYKDELLKVVSEKTGQERMLAFSLTGVYDLIFGVSVADEETLKKIVVDIRRTPGVMKTMTMIAL